MFAATIGFSYSSPKIVDIEDYLSAVNDDLSLVLVVRITISYFCCLFISSCLVQLMLQRYLYRFEY